MPYKRKKYHVGDTHLKKRWRVRNRKKDLDQIDVDLQNENADKLLNQNVDLDLPGAAQHYCLHCARYFIDEHALSEHFKTKVHKRRLKALELEPYTIEDSERAAGLGNFKLPNKRKIVTQDSKKIDNQDITDIEPEEVSPGKKVCDFTIICKRNSALFINSLKATENFVYITPHVDYEERIKKKDKIISELEKRRYKFDLTDLENLWSVYADLKNRKHLLESNKRDVSKELSELIKMNKESDQIQKLTIHISLVKENINKLKVPLWSAEEAAIVKFLKLPNELHSLTPYDQTVLYEFGSKPSNNKNHLNIGEENNLIHFTKNENYYLKKDAALFELGAKFFFSETLKLKNYTQFSNPDFTKSLVIEGCGETHTDPNATFILHHNEDTKVNIDSRLHLTGAGSLYSFLAYYSKNIIISKYLPLKYFSLGRQYVPSPIEEDSLLHVSQSSVVQLFGITRNGLEADDILQETIATVKALYADLGYHFRLKYVPASELKMWESLRLAIEMYSSSLNSYVEIGNISMSGDFISKRLMIMYDEARQHKFPHIICGTILNVPKFLACVLEQDDDFILPEQFKVENWGKSRILRK